MTNPYKCPVCRGNLNKKNKYICIKCYIEKGKNS